LNVGARCLRTLTETSRRKKDATYTAGRGDDEATELQQKLQAVSGRRHYVFLTRVENHFGVGSQLLDYNAPEAVASAGIVAAGTFLHYVVLPVLLAAGQRSYSDLPVLWPKGKSQQADTCLKDVESVLNTALQRAKVRGPFSRVLANAEGRGPSSFKRLIPRVKCEIMPARLRGFTASIPPPRNCNSGRLATYPPSRQGYHDKCAAEEGWHVRSLSLLRRQASARFEPDDSKRLKQLNPNVVISPQLYKHRSACPHHEKGHDA